MKRSYVCSWSDTNHSNPNQTGDIAIVVGNLSEASGSKRVTDECGCFLWFFKHRFAALQLLHGCAEQQVPQAQVTPNKSCVNSAIRQHHINYGTFRTRLAVCRARMLTWLGAMVDTAIARKQITHSSPSHGRRRVSKGLPNSAYSNLLSRQAPEAQPTPLKGAAAACCQ